MQGYDQRAQHKTLASNQASLRLSAAANAVAERLLAAQHGRGEGPTEAQLDELRRRHLEFEALDRAQREAWQLVRSNPLGEIAGTVATCAYRLTVFAAACVVLWRYFGHA